VIWLTGGPGCSSELALFYENGPFKIANNMSLLWNDYGWDKVILISFVAFQLRLFYVPMIILCEVLINCLVTFQVSNLLYVDQPTGTGFSYSTDNRDIRHDEEGVSNDLYDFLQVLVFAQNTRYTALMQCLLIWFPDLYLFFFSGTEAVSPIFLFSNIS